MNLAARKAKHRAAEKAKRGRKAARKARAVVHAAMVEATRMKRSKEKGTADRDNNMFDLGFVREEFNVCDGEAKAHDVLAKFRPRDMAHEFRFDRMPVA